MAEVLSKIRSSRSGSDLLQNGGCCGSSGLAIVVPRRSWRGTFCKNLRRAKISWGQGDVALVPRFPGIPGTLKENSNNGKCAQENCLTGGVHPKNLGTSWEQTLTNSVQNRDV